MCWCSLPYTAPLRPSLLLSTETPRGRVSVWWGPGTTRLARDLSRRRSGAMWRSHAASDSNRLAGECGTLAWTLVPSAFHVFHERVSRGLIWWFITPHLVMWMGYLPVVFFVLGSFTWVVRSSLEELSDMFRGSRHGDELSLFVAHGLSILEAPVDNTMSTSTSGTSTRIHHPATGANLCSTPPPVFLLTHSP